MLSHINLTLIASLFLYMCCVSLLANRIIRTRACSRHDVETYGSGAKLECKPNLGLHFKIRARWVQYVLILPI
jgi:NADH:ubiquinone oxidoreductase subunit 3 (subunit A)